MFMHIYKCSCIYIDVMSCVPLFNFSTTINSTPMFWSNKTKLICS